MKILIIGGTQFVGRAITETAMAAGHVVTLFNRGKTASGLFPKAEHLTGDRDGGLEPLKGRTWDAVIDVCGYFPRIVKQSTELLKDACRRYLFVSTISVYDSFAEPGLNEDSSLGTTDKPDIEEITEDSYGPLKVLCEQAVTEAFGERSLIVRPGFIVGPYDPTDRFSYWPHRVFGGGEFLAPGPPDRAMQFIDVRDLAEWAIRLVEADTGGIFNATGPDYDLTFRQLIDQCREAANKEAKPVWVETSFLEENEITFGKDFPFIYPGEEYAGLMYTDCSRAVAAGLTYRPLSRTIRDTMKWLATRSLNYEWKAGIDPEREQELIRKLKKKQQIKS